jgi:hypothetical protein
VNSLQTLIAALLTTCAVMLPASSMRPSAYQPSPGLLTSEQINDALRTAESGPLPTYSLKWRRPNVSTAAVVGEVFTPWLRVVCFAKEQLAAGDGPEPADVRSDLVQPIALIGFYGAAGNYSETRTTVQAIPHTAGDWAAGQEPLWIRLGETVPCGMPAPRRFMAVAAFQQDDVAPGTDIVMRTGTPLKFSIVRGTIDVEDLAAWK